MTVFKRRKEDKAKVATAKAEAEQAKTEYRWAVQQRTTVMAVVSKIRDHGERNNIVENMTTVLRGGHK